MPLTNTGKHLPYADNCVALSLSKTLSKPQAQVVREMIETYPSVITTWSDLEEDSNLKVIFGDTKHWSPVKVGGGQWSEISSLCLGGNGGKQRYFAIHWGDYPGEKWGIPKLTFHAICIQVSGGSLVVFGNNEEIQEKRDASGSENNYRQVGTQSYASAKMKPNHWVSAWRWIGT